MIGAHGDDDNGTNSGSSYIYRVSHDVNVSENSTDVEDLNISDEDGDTISYSLSGNDADKFSIDANASLSFIDAPDYENPTDSDHDNTYEVTVTAEDEHNASSSLIVLVYVQDVSGDGDGDGMDDDWEYDNFGDLSHDGTADSDSDGLTDKQEYDNGTNPNNSDSDGDGVSDGDEVANLDDPNTPRLSIEPMAYLFNEASGTKTFIVRNTGNSSITLSGATLEDGDTDSFSINSDGCDGQTLQNDDTCSISVDYPSSSSQSLSTTLNVSNVRAFLYNYESTDQEASRRLPPVIDTINIPENMSVGEDYNLTFSLMGYDDNYNVYVVLFNCEGVDEGACANSYNAAERFESSTLLTPYQVEASSWHYGTKTANRFHFSYSFTPQSDEFTDGNNTIILRFYYKTHKDKVAGDNSVSVVVPGNLSDHYYDTSGRKIEKNIVK